MSSEHEYKTALSDVLNQLEIAEDYGGRLLELARPHLTEEQILDFGWHLGGLTVYPGMEAAYRLADLPYPGSTAGVSK